MSLKISKPLAIHSARKLKSDIALDLEVVAVGFQNHQFDKELYHDISSKKNELPISFVEAFPLEERTTKFNDWPFIILFVAALFGFIAIASLTLRYWTHNYSQNGSGIYGGADTGTLDSNSAVLLIFSTVVAIFFATFGIIFVRLWPSLFIYCGVILNLLAGLGSTITYMVLGYWSGAIVFLAFTLITVWCYWSMRHRIPLSVALLRSVVDGMKDCPQTLIVSSLGTLGGTAFTLLFSAVVVATYMKYDHKDNQGDCKVGECHHSQSKLVGTLVVIFFCGYYISEVLRNVIHCTVSGVYGCWYYRSRLDYQVAKWPATGSFKRALTHSFGSICLGSLLVSCIEVIRQLLRLLESSLHLGHSIGSRKYLGFSLIDKFVSFFVFSARYFNHYAYCFISLYGKPYMKAAKEVWFMMQEKGVDILVNDSLVNIALMSYSIFAAYMSTLFAFLYLRFTSPEYNSSKSFNVPLMAFSFLIAIQLCNLVNETIRSGVSTLFVAICSDPELFHATNPRRFEDLFRGYSNVVRKLSHSSI
ncbi:related to protein PNS1 [Zygosaccharomyces bailii]|nr:related to protein PNS1 [Zygosaccharomyces bailii]